MNDEKKNPLYFLIAIAFFFCTVHYSGIRIDGELYTLQVIHNWFPERFIGDVSFAYGNQDSFTIFSPFYGLFLKLFSVDVAAKVVCLISQFTFAAFFFFFLRKMFGQFLELKFILLVFLAFFIIYLSGTNKTELYFTQLVEPYPVPRTLSVAFGIAGLGFLIKEKRLLSLLTIIVGSLFHPLMAGWALALWIFYFFPKLRIPVAAVSALLPFSSFLDIGPFAAYPEGWLTDPLLYSPNIPYCIRYVMYFCFIGFLFKRITISHEIKKIVYPLLWALGISFYWYLSTGVGRNIFVYQMQPWRVEWLCIVVLVPILCLVLIEIFRRLKKERSLNIWDLSFIAFALSIFSDSQIPDGLILSIILFIFPNKRVSPKILAILGVTLSVLNICASNAVDLFWSGFNFGNLVDYGLLYTMQLRYTIYTSVMSLILAVYAFRKKQYFRFGILLTYLIFPQILILPLIGVLYGYMKKVHLCGILIIAVLDVIFEGVSRITLISFSNFEKLQLFLTIIAILCLIPFFVRFRKSLKVALYCIPFVFMAPYSMAHYEHREDELIEAESYLDQFKQETIFPFVKERGKMFFYMDGVMNDYSRLQFMTGNYFDMGSNSGGVFLKKQYDEIRHRECLTVYKTDNCKTGNDFSIRQNFIHDFFKKSLSNQDTLVDRIKFLCTQNEISYLVANCLDISLPKVDSMEVDGLDKKVCLYTCPRRI